MRLSRYFSTNKQVNKKKEIVIETALMKDYLRVKESPKTNRMKKTNRKEWTCCSLGAFFIYIMMDKIWEGTWVASNLFVDLPDVRAR